MLLHVFELAGFLKALVGVVWGVSGLSNRAELSQPSVDLVNCCQGLHTCSPMSHLPQQFLLLYVAFQGVA